MGLWTWSIECVFVKIVQSSVLVTLLALVFTLVFAHLYIMLCMCVLSVASAYFTLVHTVQLQMDVYKSTSEAPT